MRILVLCLIMAGCSPARETIDAPTKYPNTPTMQSAEDATKGVL